MKRYTNLSIVYLNGNKTLSSQLDYKRATKIERTSGHQKNPNPLDYDTMSNIVSIRTMNPVELATANVSVIRDGHEASYYVNSVDKMSEFGKLRIAKVLQMVRVKEMYKTIPSKTSKPFKSFNSWAEESLSTMGKSQANEYAKLADFITDDGQHTIFDSESRGNFTFTALSELTRKAKEIDELADKIDYINAYIDRNGINSEWKPKRIKNFDEKKELDGEIVAEDTATATADESTETATETATKTEKKPEKAITLTLDEARAIANALAKIKRDETLSAIYEKIAKAIEV